MNILYKSSPVVGNSHKTFVHFSNSKKDKYTFNNKNKNNLWYVTDSKIFRVRSRSDLSEYLDTDDKNEKKMKMKIKVF